ncbi:MAG: carboxypeptidase regulatory-like domain-containing protein [Acidobacteriota bacterium]|nr:MAG: carboxypeptidase regulatory-like domain-containing protein [Acidobacteriota bacterium]
MIARLIPTRLIFALLITALSCTFVFAQDEDLEPWEREVPPPKPGIATVKGKVIYEDTGRPLRYGVVGLKAVDGDFESDFVRTDGEGNYEIRKVPAGTFHPFVKTAGVLNPETVDNYPAFEGADPPVVEFQKIEIVGPGEYRIDLKAKRGGTLSGTVKYSDGEVGVGLQVKAILLMGPRSSGKTIEIAGEVLATTDGGGFYRITGLLPGDYIVSIGEPAPHKYESVSSDLDLWDTFAIPPPATLLSTFAPSVTNAAEAETVTLLAGGERTGVDITIPDRRLFSISGTVVEKGSGNPVHGITVRFEPVLEFPEFFTGNAGSDLMRSVELLTGGSDEADVDEEGRWEVRYLPKGKYKLTFKQTGSSPFMKYQPEDPEKEYYPAVTKVIVIDDSNISNLIVEIPRGATVRGLVATSDGSDLPEDTLLMIADTKRENWKILAVGEAPADSGVPAGAKVFRAVGLGEGMYKIHADFDDHYIRSVSVSGRDMTHREISIKAGDELNDIVVILGTDMGTVAGRINGFVRDPATLLDGIVLVRESGPGSLYERASFDGANPDGTFDLGLQPGTYKYSLWKFLDPDEKPEEVERRLAAAIVGAPTITVKAGETTTLILEYKK